MKTTMLRIILLMNLYISLSFSQSNNELNLREIELGNSLVKFDGGELSNFTFEEIIKKLGPSRYYESGDASEYSKRIHYFLEKQKIYLSFESGELGGEKWIDYIKMSFTKPKEEFTINKHYQIKKNDFGGIKLGISKKKFYGYVPKKFIRATNIVFDYSIPMSQEDATKYGIKDKKQHFIDEYISISPKFSGDTLIELKVIKSISN